MGCGASASASASVVTVHAPEPAPRADTHTTAPPSEAATTTTVTVQVSASSSRAAIPEEKLLLSYESLLQRNEVSSLNLSQYGQKVKQLQQQQQQHQQQSLPSSLNVTALCNALAKNTSLTELFLNNNKLGGAASGGRAEDIAALLAQVLRAPTSRITSLSLLGNSLSDKDIATLVPALKANSVLTYLDLSKNQFGDEGAELLAEVLSPQSTSSSSSSSPSQSRIKILNLSGNGISDKGALALAASLRSNTSLVSLYLSNNKQITAAGAGDALCAAVEANSTLQELQFVGVGLSPQQAGAIRRRLRKNKEGDGDDGNGAGAGASAAAVAGAS